MQKPSAEAHKSEKRLHLQTIIMLKIISSSLALATLLATGATAQVFGSHCEQGPDRKYLLSIQEIQSPTGPRHSDAIQNTGGDPAAGTGLGYVWFDNDLVKPGFGPSMGDQTGHCIQVSYDDASPKLACYFNFNVDDEDGCSGRITAEALFDLANFPQANLVITGGTGAFEGIRGSGCTQAIDDLPEGVASFIYNFSYDIAGGKSLRASRACHGKATAVKKGKKSP